MYIAAITEDGRVMATYSWGPTWTSSAGEKTVFGTIEDNRIHIALNRQKSKKVTYVIDGNVLRGTYSRTFLAYLGASNDYVTSTSQIVMGQVSVPPGQFLTLYPSGFGRMAWSA